MKPNTTLDPTPRSHAMEVRLAQEDWRKEQDATDEVLALAYELEKELNTWRKLALAAGKGAQ